MAIWCEGIRAPPDLGARPTLVYHERQPLSRVPWRKSRRATTLWGAERQVREVPVAGGREGGVAGHEAGQPELVLDGAEPGRAPARPRQLQPFDQLLRGVL